MNAKRVAASARAYRQRILGEPGAAAAGPARLEDRRRAPPRSPRPPLRCHRSRADADAVLRPRGRRPGRAPALPAARRPALAVTAAAPLRPPGRAPAPPLLPSPRPRRRPAPVRRPRRRQFRRRRPKPPPRPLPTPAARRPGPGVAQVPAAPRAACRFRLRHRATTAPDADQRARRLAGCRWRVTQ